MTQGYRDPGFESGPQQRLRGASQRMWEKCWASIPWPKQMVLKTGAAEHEPLQGPGFSSVLKERHESWGQGRERRSEHGNQDQKQKNDRRFRLTPKYHVIKQQETLYLFFEHSWYRTKSLLQMFLTQNINVSVLQAEGLVCAVRRQACVLDSYQCVLPMFFPTSPVSAELLQQRDAQDWHITSSEKELHHSAAEDRHQTSLMIRWKNFILSLLIVKASGPQHLLLLLHFPNILQLICVLN